MSKYDIPSGFCVVPWLSLYIQNDGRQNVCCYFQDDGFTPNALLDKKHPLETSKLSSLRKEIMDDKIPSGCSSCHLFEKNGGTSHRLKRNSECSQYVEKIIESRDSPLPLSHMELRVGNLCNLRCRMCDPSATLKWIDHWNELHPEQYKLEEYELKEASKVAWCEQAKYWESIQNHLDDLLVLEFAGGEPFFSKKVLEFLVYLVDKNLAHDISLSFITNLTILPDDFLSLFSEFKQVSFTISIDGVYGLNDYIRTGSKFDVIHENLKRLDRDFNILNINRLGINTTLQVYNALGIKNLVQYLSQFKNVDQLPHLSPLSYPEYFAIEVLPLKLKEMAAKEIQSIIDSNVDRKDWLMSSFYQALELLNLPTNDNLLSVLKQETLKLDRHDKLSLKEIAPELYLNLYL
jgi:MoaA/NifB/PqqE/SkfB family radical SAM enzyme